MYYGAYFILLQGVMENSLVSIAMATYNGERFLREQIDSLAKQTYTNLEIIICDDCSTDDTWPILEEYARTDSRIQIFQNKKNLGTVKNFETAISKCKGAFIALSDQDDIWLSQKIEICMQHMLQTTAAHPDIPVLVHTDLCLIDETGKTLASSMWNEQNTFPHLYKHPEQVAVHNFVTGCTLLMNRESLGISLPFPPEVVMHDWWIALNVIKKGLIVSVDIPTILYRQHGSNQIGFQKTDTTFFIQKIFQFSQTIGNNQKVWHMLKALDFPISILKLIYYKIVFSIFR